MPAQPLSAVRAWSAGHPAFIAAFAVSLAEIGRSAAHIAHIGRQTDYGRQIPMRRDLDRWLSYYRNHRRMGVDKAFAAKVRDSLVAQARRYSAAFKDAGGAVYYSNSAEFIAYWQAEFARQGIKGIRWVLAAP